jgi:hypothetical protein
MTVNWKVAERCSHVTFVTVCVVLLVAGVFRYMPHTATAHAKVERPGADDVLDPALLDIPHDTESILLIAISPGCRYCADSMPFYSRVLTLSRKSRRHVAVVFSSSFPVAITRPYLLGHHVDAGHVVQTPPGILVTGTPTVMLAGADGRVTARWLGRLDPTQETTLTRLFE